MTKSTKTKAILNNAAKNTVLAALYHYQRTDQGKSDFRSFETDQLATGQAEGLAPDEPLDDEGLDGLIEALSDVDAVEFR